jgi:hypothetical protein
MEYQAKYNKSYNAEEEFAMRMKLFSKRVKEHKAHNS